MTDACRAVLDEALRRGGDLGADSLATMAAAPADLVDDSLRTFAAEHGAAALPVLTALASDRAAGNVRRAARRALYRLAQRGVTPPPPAPRRPVVEREVERATRAWISGVDGAGSRAAWILFQGGFGRATLCSLILNDVAGILDAAGGEITKKRLERELAALRASQKLPWVETAADRVVGLVGEALTLHAALRTTPPAAFARWRHLFAERPLLAVAVSAEVDERAVERSPELLELPELAGWFLDPEALQSDALELLQARESRLVVSEQVKGEREAAIVDGVVGREITPEASRRWARRLAEMALIFRATARPEPAALAEAAAGAFADEARDPRRHPFAVNLTRRGLEMASEVALGRVSMAEVSRRPDAAGT